MVIAFQLEKLRFGIDAAVESALAKEKEELRRKEKKIREDAEEEIASV